ncbi:unnamed protein product [Gongylonema pulchrum]|uniref:NADH dehydrogenase [ubiquinone] 1 alpha subcomplex subunit 12 n=1 Tax=Gongylonema pulchrum TaxID=637853 RepID=A0A183DNI0_9BILA|nr:unnamed protein product [Gongylonema pulchrum]
MEVRNPVQSLLMFRLSVRLCEIYLYKCKAPNASCFVFIVWKIGFIQNVNFLLSKIGLTNPGGYFVQDLWSGRHKGLFRPNDEYYTTVNPTGIDFIKATLPDLYSGW